MNPNRMGLEEQTEAHALLAKAANHPDWRSPATPWTS
jgi:hypothetical protein